MDILELMINKSENFSEYRHLRNYVLYRQSCINSEGKTVEVKLPEEIIRKYVKTYEELSDIYLEAEYKDYKNIIKSNTEEIIFDSKRLDGIRIKLSCKPNHLQLYLFAEPYPNLQRQYNHILKTEILGVNQPTPDNSAFGIATIIDRQIDEYNVPRTYFFSQIEFTPEGLIISNASTKIPDMIGEEISGRSQTLGIIPLTPPPN